ncbi:hypothetical protein Ptr902_07121 [Pyrenophora tritici-repentis]|nr:hypothetical protein Ptr902_13882 [Pyrenophora tritici-repentis]KAI2481326.1 hypothetical protein Ptr902_07121 [Pyrenophora tritici-repentis]
MKISIILSIAFATLGLAARNIMHLDKNSIEARTIYEPLAGGIGYRAYVDGSLCCCTECTPVDCTHIYKE